MRNPLTFMEPLLSVLGSQLQVLPATGGAVEEMERPDEDELDDMLLNANTGEITRLAERPAPGRGDY